MPIPKAALDKVPADKRAALEQAVAGLDDFVKELEAGYMRQDDYSAKMDAWQKEKKTYETNWATAKDQYDQMFEDWKKGEATMTELTDAKKKLADAESKVKELEGKAPAIDPSKVVSPEQVQEQLNQFAAGQTQYFIEASDMAYEIEGLLKQRISPGTLISEALKAKKTPKAYAEEKYELPKKREEAAAAAKAEQERTIREDERKKVVSELANPATRPLQDSKDTFYTEKGAEGPKHPWQMTETPADEVKLLEELTQAAGR